MADSQFQIGALLFFAILILSLAYLYLSRRRRRIDPTAVVVIQEGRYHQNQLPRETCPSCGRKFIHATVLEGEMVKCPYCGNEIE